MATNTTPIFSRTGDQSNNTSGLTIGTGMNAAVLTAAADYTGVSTNNVLLFTAGTNGSFIQRIRFKAIGTNVASVARIYLNNGSTHATATNNSFYGEISLPAITASAVIATVELDYPMLFALPPSWTLWWGLGTTVAAGWVATAIAGQY